MSIPSLPPADRHSCHHPACCPAEAVATAATHSEAEGEAGLHHHEAGVHRTMGSLKRWLLWFLTFFGIYASSSVCPFCGTTGCPVGAGGAAVVGGFFAALWQYGRTMGDWLRTAVTRKKR
ncbi:MAG: hypothetical protein ACUVXF_09295 [Desulfobaccales bacterium]